MVAKVSNAGDEAEGKQGHVSFTRAKGGKNETKVLP